MAGIRFLDGVQRERTDCIDRKLCELRIAVCRANGSMNIGSCRQGHTGESGVFGQQAVADLQRALKTQEFLHGRGDKTRLLDQPLMLIGMR